MVPEKERHWQEGRPQTPTCLLPCPEHLPPELSVSQFSRSVMSDSLWPHGLQDARLHCSSSTPGPCSNSWPLSQWCHPTISSSVVPFSSQLQSFPASASFPRSHFLASGGQSIGVSASAPVLLMNIQDWFPSGWTDLISFQSKGLSRVFPKWNTKEESRRKNIHLQQLQTRMTKGSWIRVRSKLAWSRSSRWYFRDPSQRPYNAINYTKMLLN